MTVLVSRCKYELLALVITHLTINQCYECFDVNVAQTTGKDVEACLEPNSTANCKTIQYAVQGMEYNMNQTTLRVVITDDVYLISETIEIIQPSEHRSLVITSSSGLAIVLCINKTAGVDIGSRMRENRAHTRNVQFSNILFQQCGPIRAAVVQIWNARSIAFKNCEFSNNSQAAINAFDSSVAIENCVFMNNSFNQNAGEPFEPGVASMSGAVGYLVTSSSHLSLTIRDSVFHINAAVQHDDDFYVSAAMNYTEYSEDGGAILIIFTSEAKDCNVTLDNLRVTENSATYGGGIFVATGGVSSGSQFTLSNSVISRNKATQAGGGLCISQWDYTQKSRFLLKNCTISKNKSRRGGGINGFFMSFRAKTHSQLDMVDLVVQANVAKSSPGFRFTSSLPWGNPPDLVPVFTNCTISHHVSSCSDVHTYLAPITAQRISLAFAGRNLIAHNTGAGGMDAENTVLHIKGELCFVNNTGYTGGALRLWSSQVMLYPDSHLMFYNNFANTMGGAMSVKLFPTFEVIHEYNADCFLTYSKSLTPPSQWQTNVTFIKNGAKLKGAAVYVSSLASCLWDEEYPYYNISRSLRWLNDRFVYKDNFLLTGRKSRRLSGRKYDIATDTAKLDDGGKQKKVAKLSPGEDMKVHLCGLDELGNMVYTIASLSDSTVENGRHEHLSMDSPLHVLSAATNDTLSFSYHVSEDHFSRIVNHTHDISVMGVYSTHNVNYDFTVQAVPCWPGYKFEDSGCVCDKTISGVIRCDNRGRTVYLEEGIWGGVYNGSLVTYVCPYNYCHCNRDPDDPPGCRFDPDDINSQCQFGREGVLCGECKKGLSVGLLGGDCIECYHGGWILAIVIIIVVIMCLIVIWLNPGMSKDLRGPLFFFQMLPFIFVPSDGVGEVVTIVSYVLDFGGPLAYFWKTCIREGIDNLYAVAMGYMMPATTLLMFLLAYILSSKRVIRMKPSKTSCLQSFWVLMLFMYKYLIETTLRLLHCPFVNNKMVFFYDGNVECFHGKHLIIAVVAMLVLGCLVIPPPIIIVVLTLGYWKVDPQYFSTLTEGLQPHCPWWWAVDLGRRIVIVGIYVFVPRWRTKQIWMIIASIIVLAVHSNIQPYKKLHTNLVESLYLFTLCIMTIVQILEDDHLRGTISASLLIIATIHCNLLLIYKSWQFFRKRWRCSCALFFRKQRTYGTLDDSGEILARDNQERLMDAEVKARQALFESVFASSDEE